MSDRGGTVQGVLAAAIAVAISVWGPAPCQPAYRVADLPAPVLGMFVRHPDGQCEVLIGAGRWNWWKLCAVADHEQGHAAGYTDPVGVLDPITGLIDHGHSPDPASVMYPQLWRRADACIGRRPAGYPPGATIRLSVR